MSRLIFIQYKDTEEIWYAGRQIADYTARFKEEECEDADERMIKRVANIPSPGVMSVNAYSIII